MIRKHFLIVRADGSPPRVVTKRPRLRWDEVAFELNVRVPDTWGEVIGAIDVEMPEPPPVPELKAVKA